MTNNAPLRDSARRVQDFLLDRGFTLEVKALPGDTRTAQAAADAVGCAVFQIAKSLVFKDKATQTPKPNTPMEVPR